MLLLLLLLRLLDVAVFSISGQPHFPATLVFFFSSLSFFCLTRRHEQVALVFFVFFFELSRLSGGGPCVALGNFMQMRARLVGRARALAAF